MRKSTRSTRSTAAISTSSRGSRRTSCRTVRSTCMQPSSVSSISSSPRRIRACGKASIRPARMLAAVSTPGVHILGHPRGRKFNSRAGVIADWPAVFKRAAETGVAIELDGDVSRQDLDYRIADGGEKGGMSLRARQRCARRESVVDDRLRDRARAGWQESRHSASSIAGRASKYRNGLRPCEEVGILI